MEKQNRKLALGLNLLMLIIGLYAVLHMALFGVSAVLVSSGWQVLVYFTVDSNLLLLVSSGMLCVRLLTHGNEPIPTPLLALRSAAVAGTTLTFLVVMCYLGVIHGYAKVLSGENLYLHLVLPLLGLASLTLFETGELPFRSLWWALVPPLIYGIVTVIRVLNGAKPPYPFMDVVNLPIYRSVFSYALLAAACYGSALAVWAARRKTQK